MATPLLFEDPPYGSGPISLIFGGSGSVVALPAVVTVYDTMASPVLSMAAVYDNRLPSWRDQRVTANHEVATALRDGVQSGWGVTERKLGGTGMPWNPAAATGLATRVAFGISASTESAKALVWGVARPISRSLISVQETALRVQQQSVLHWGLATPLGVGLTGVMETALGRHVVLVPGWQVATRLGFDRTGRYAKGTARTAAMQIMPWEQAGRPRHGGGGVWPPVVVPPGYYDHNTQLLFQCPPLGAPYMLLFGEQPCYLVGPGAPLFIIPSRFYMTVNTVLAQLLPSLDPVTLYAGTTISADIGSYGWTLSATGPAALYDQLKPAPGQPKQIRVTINGVPWVFAVDQPSKTESFGKKVVSITGRSVTAALGPAFALETARMNTTPYMAQQLAALALDNTGITLDWGIEDWLVPAGAWSHYGTPLAAVQAIAQAAGGYVQSGRSAAVLQVRHPYPLLPGGVPGGPWNWNGAFAADVSIAPDVIVSRSEELNDSPAINAVYVSGISQGVSALVKRAGTAGDLIGAQVTDALITASEVAQQRGLAVLGAAGGRVMRRLELPVLTGASQPGVLSTDQLIEVTDAVPWRGRVRAVSVSDNRPSVRQSVLVEVA